MSAPAIQLVHANVDESRSSSVSVAERLKKATKRVYSLVWREAHVEATLALDAAKHGTISRDEIANVCGVSNGLVDKWLDESTASSIGFTDLVLLARSGARGLRFVERVVDRLQAIVTYERTRARRPKLSIDQHFRIVLSRMTDVVTARTDAERQRAASAFTDAVRALERDLDSSEERAAK